MGKQELKKCFNSIQGLIGEYESKTDNPSLDGFSMWLERKKQYALLEYEKALNIEVVSRRRQRNV